MDVTDMDAKAADRDARPDTCLHCVVMTAIEDWFERHGKRVNGQVVVDVIEVASKLAECTVQVISMIPDRNQRRRALRMAHDAIDANVKSQQTGKLVALDVPAEH